MGVMARDELLRPDPAEGPALGESRSRVLELLQASDAPLGVDEVAQQVGLHANTTRFHLDGLVEQRLARRENEERDTPGRPRALYSAVPHGARAGRRSYRLLAEILTSYLASSSRQPARAALKAGEAWGRFLAERPAPFRKVDAPAATRQLVDTLDDIGFAPEPVIARRQRRILLHHCPFREAAEEHREVVCAVHLGLMRGLLAELDAPIDATRLEPFVEPGLCVTHLASRAARGSATPSELPGRD